jgi:protein-disulfide reductase (glutathione)
MQFSLSLSLIAYLGYGDDIDWVRWKDAVKLAQQRGGQPILLLIHRWWCRSCRGARVCRILTVLNCANILALKINLAASSHRQQLIELSKKFVMVNVDEPDEPQGNEYHPDGYYFPRIIFLGI